MLTKIFRKSSKLLFLTAVFVFSGCSEDFLTPDPLSFYEPTTTFTTESGLLSTLAMCDRHLRSYYTYWEAQDRGLPISTEYMFSEISVHGMTDNSHMFSDITNYLTPSNYLYDEEDANRIAYFWYQSYTGVKYANTVITYIDDVEDLDTNLRNEYLGRAYFHRAYRYFALVFQFKNVPLVSKIIDNPKLDYKSTKREAILDMITEDMENAVEWVPEQSEMDYIGMVSKGACRQLLIKCYLAQGEWAKAIEQADILIDQSGYSLMTSTFGTFEDPMDETWPITRNVIWDLHRPVNRCIVANTEAILSLPNEAGTDAAIKMRSMRNWLPHFDGRTDFKSPAGYTGIIYYAPSSESYNSKYDYRTAYGRGIAHVRSTKYFTDDIWQVNDVEDEGDLRHSSAVGNWMRMDSLKYDNPEDTLWYGKNVRFKDDDGNILIGDTIRSWFDWPHYKTYIEDEDELTESSSNHRGGAGAWYCYRLAETYLLRAEAKLYNGDVSGATSDVNVIRERAGCDQLYSTVNIGDIMDERARELYMEEWRHMELSRVSYCMALSGIADEWGNTYSVNDEESENSYWYQRVNAYNNYYNKGVVVPTLSNRAFKISPYNIYYPVPQDEIDANREGTLYQNYGYDGYDASIEMWDNWEDAVADEDTD